jgi:hypothetical protein
MGQAIAGTCYVKADGQQFSVMGGIECPLFDVKRESVLPGLYKEEDLTPYVKVDAAFTKDFPINKLRAAKDMTVTVEYRNGRVYVLTEAYVVGEPAASGDDGKVPLEFNGRKGVWQ